MEEVKKMEKTGGDGDGETTNEYLLFHGDIVFVTEMNVVCLSGPVTGEEHITVTVKRNCRYLGEKDLHYTIGKSVKLGFLIKDYCDRNHLAKSNFHFTPQKTSKEVAENQTPDELGMRHGDVILVSFKPAVLQELEDTETETGSKQEELKVAGNPLAQFQKGAGLMVCRTCGKKGYHWTSRCPYKDLAQPMEGFTDKPAASEAATTASGPTKGEYVPPGMRAGAKRTGGLERALGEYVPPGMRAGAKRTGGLDVRRRNDENSVRVSNLSEDTRGVHLLELFRPFGPVSRVYVVVDQRTLVSRGFGFVSFVNREHAQRAIDKLNGYGYDSLILKVEWATPRAN